MEFYSNGKLLITGEYLVLDAAEALAIPTKFGQYLTVDVLKNRNQILIWQAINEKNETWFQCELKLPNFELKNNSFENVETQKVARKLQHILGEVRKLNPKFLISNNSYHIKTRLNFPRNWGLGTSSTLVNNIAKWANVDAFKLQFNTFGGSAYDIACAQNNTPIIYQLIKNKPLVKAVKFNPKFKDNIYFVYLNEKKNSRDAIKNYQKNRTQNNVSVIEKITEITHKIYAAKNLETFDNLLREHEQLIAKIIAIKPIKEQLFSDYFGQIKSLGAWEGDFILATGNKQTPNYFKAKGFEIVIPFSEMIL